MTPYQWVFVIAFIVCFGTFCVAMLSRGISAARKPRDPK